MNQTIVRPICWCADLVVLSPLDVLAIVWLSYTCLMRSSLWYYFLAPWSDNPLPKVGALGGVLWMRYIIFLRYLLAIAHLRGFCIAGGRLFVGVGGSI